MSKSFCTGTFRDRRFPGAYLLRDVGWFDLRADLKRVEEAYMRVGYEIMGENFQHPDKTPLVECDVGVYFPACGA